MLAAHLADTHHRRLGHRGVRVEHVLDLTRVHVEAAADDQVFLALDDVEEPVGVEPPDVAGVQPAVAQGARRLLGQAVVAEHHVRSAHADLTRVADGKRAVVVIEDRDLDAGERLAHGAELAHAREPVVLTTGEASVRP